MNFFAWRLIIINTFLYKIWFFHTLPSEASTLWFILILLFFFLINIFFWTFISVLDKTTYSDFFYTFYCFISYLAQGPAVIQRIVLPLGRACVRYFSGLCRNWDKLKRCLTPKCLNFSELLARMQIRIWRKEESKLIYLGSYNDLGNGCFLSIILPFHVSQLPHGVGVKGLYFYRWRKFLK